MTQTLLRLFRFRWSVPILATLGETDSTKFVTLAVTLGISRSVLTSTLKALISDGWVAPNPGYGHPLRPEYILTASGGALAGFCQEITRCVRDRGEDYLLQSRWALPVLFTLGDGAARFGELRRRLTTIGSRALSEELKRLVETGHVNRSIRDGFPPAAVYTLGLRGGDHVGIYMRYRGALEV